MTTDSGDKWDVGSHSAITGPTLGTVKADANAIRALADWLTGTLSADGGLFTAGLSWLTDCSQTGGYNGAALHYDLYATRTAGKGGALAGPDVTAVGILPGYAKDDSYLPSAYALKSTVDAQLSTLYLRLKQDPNSSQMSDGNLYTMVSTLADTLHKVANDYTKGDQQIQTDLGDLANSFQSALSQYANIPGISGVPGSSGSSGNTGSSGSSGSSGNSGNSANAANSANAGKGGSKS